MVSGPTTGANEESRTWASRPLLATLFRVALFLAPILVGWLAVRATGSLYWRPAGWGGVAIWVAQAIVVASSAAHLTKHWAQRFAPMPLLLNMTMVFPDRAPSRFGITLRAGNLKKLTPEQLILSENTQEAAEQAIALVAELGRHEPRTRGHTERVRAYAELIGEEMGLDDDELNHLRWGALLHDVGKLTVPAHILNGNNKPTEDEWLILKQHPLEGQKILKPLHGWLGEWAFVSLHHHERWDGGGYPVGLKGEEISRGGRIAAVADAFDVITSKRTYKEAMSYEAAREELVRCAGAQFDPEVVRAFLRIGLDDRSRSLGFLGWLFEFPSVARISGSVTSAAQTTVTATATAATAVGVSVISLVGAGVADAPSSIAFVAPEPEIVEVDASTTSVLRDFAVGETGANEIPPTAPTVTQPTPSAATPTTVTVASSIATTSTIRSTTTAPQSTTTAAPTTTTTAAPTTTTTPAPTTTTNPPGSPTTTSTTAAPTTSTTAAPTTTTTTNPPGSPTAQSDTKSMRTREKKSIKVLENDIEGANPLDKDTLRILVAPQHAVDYQVHDDHIHYDAGVDEVVDTLVYEICDSAGLCDQATLTITVYAD